MTVPLPPSYLYVKRIVYLASRPCDVNAGIWALGHVATAYELLVLLEQIITQASLD